MTGPGQAVAAVRLAVREFFAVTRPPSRIDVAVSGGADSLALTEATAHAAHRAGLRVRALVVDHGLQAGSGKTAEDAAATARALGADEAKILTATVHGPGGPEAAARRARYDALRRAAPADALVLLGHTRDDQAETVLLGLGRGSGPRSLAGMRPHNPPWGRPLLDVTRATTARACAELGVEPWHDPHNTDSRFTRVRLRTEVLPLLEDVLSGGVAAALARTATQLREDNEALDTLADALLSRSDTGDGLDVAVLAAEPPALRRRVLRRWLLLGGVRELTDAHLRAVDALIGRWRGQGGVWLPGELEARRAHGRLCLKPQSTTRGE
ncbi:tRNA lysidine(34) synthetase TilS [Amycolatopsis samaneae]|uniref:tRNA(Ile)-lysidine synthase n=1 Tax=Amycolatopsis samaneae TaxID=664691 RepID=A0ABW5GJK2_9PSEU